MIIIRFTISLFFILGLILTTGCVASQQDLDAVLKKIDSIDAAMTSLKSELAETQSRIDTIKNQLETEKNELGKIQGQVSTLQSEMLSLQSQVGIVNPGPEAQPVIWYDFDDDFLRTGTVSDKMHHGPDLNLIGTIGQASGRYGKCALFLNNGYLQANSNPTADFTSMTVSLWFRTETPENNYKLADAAWWQGGLNASGWTMATHCPEAWADNQQELFSENRNCARNVSFTPDEWIHMIITHDGKYFREYINGEISLEWPNLHGVKIGRGSNLTVGAWMGMFIFNGMIDELMIYNRALEPEEVLTLYLAQ